MIHFSTYIFSLEILRTTFQLGDNFTSWLTGGGKRSSSCNLISKRPRTAVVFNSKHSPGGQGSTAVECGLRAIRGMKQPILGRQTNHSPVINETAQVTDRPFSTCTPSTSLGQQAMMGFPNKEIHTHICIYNIIYIICVLYNQYS